MDKSGGTLALFVESIPSEVILVWAGMSKNEGAVLCGNFNDSKLGGVNCAEECCTCIVSIDNKAGITLLLAEFFPFKEHILKNYSGYLQF